MSSAQEIEREVEASRASVEETVAALKDKMTLGQIVDEAAHFFKGTSGGDVVSTLGTQIRANPLPVALVGIGIAWLMSGRGTPHVPTPSWGGGDEGVSTGAGHSAYSGTSLGHDEFEGAYASRSGNGHGNGPGLGSRLGSAASSVGSGIGSAASGLGSAVSGVAGALSGAASALSGTAGGVASAARHGGSAAYSGAGYAGRTATRGASHLRHGAADATSTLLHTEPLVLGAIGLAIGAALGALLPTTRTEERYLGEAGEKLRSGAGDLARAALDEGKAIAKDVYGAGMAKAEEAGLTGESAAGVVEKVGDVVRATVDKARETAEERLASVGSGDSGGSAASPGPSAPGTSTPGASPAGTA
jgi:hypothetical protein